MLWSGLGEADATKRQLQIRMDLELWEYEITIRGRKALE